uniref:serine/threonine-protein kinase pakE isoform X2 n=1 Tax=Scatophagus argus TaxID=75038 RepID=UPI001ED8126C|nr:serine/threonine-protein kinase pakE isoform X2 [Scatophagus argus]
MQRSEKRRSVDEMLEREQKEEEEDEEEDEEEVVVVSLGQEMKGREEHGSSSLITACRKGMTEVVERLLMAGADMTLCDCSQQTALHMCPPELQGKVLGWMSRPHLPPQAQLRQAAWQGDLHCVQNLLAQTDGLDVDVPNSDGVTAVMLAVRDISLFEAIETQLPWEHRPVEVLKELLGLPANLQVRDLRGCSALHYAANINSPLKEEIVQMMVEALSHADADPMLLPAHDKYSCQDLDSEFGDSDIELDLESFYTHRSTDASPTGTPNEQRGFLLHTGEVLESQGQPPLSDHHKGFSQDKGIPFCFQNAMETLRDIRQAYQDAGRGSRGDMSLPSLSDNSRPYLDPAPPSALLSARTSCLPEQTGLRQRTRSVVAASPSSPRLLSVAKSGSRVQLSRSAPSIMEPLLCSSTVIQARAHIQSRLGSQDTVNEPKVNFNQKNILISASPVFHFILMYILDFASQCPYSPQLSQGVSHPRTPKLLAPLDSRPRDIAALPTLKHLVPLKPISRSPLCSWTLRREKLSWGSSRTGPLTTKGGSEESGSSSSQSSIDLEDEEEDGERDTHERASGESPVNFVGKGTLQHSNDVCSTENDLTEGARWHFNGQSSISHIPPIHRSAHNLNVEPLNHASDYHSKAINSHCEGKASNMSYTKKLVDSQSFKKHTNTRQGDFVNPAQDTVNEMNEIPIKPNEEKNDVAHTTEPETMISHGRTFHMTSDQGDAIICSEGNYSISLQNIKQSERAMKDYVVDNPVPHGEQTREERTQPFTSDVNLPQSDKHAEKDDRLLKLKPVRSRERKTGMNTELRQNIQMNRQSFNILALYNDRSNLNRNKSKSNLKYSLHSTQVKDKTRKSPELIISGETVTKVKSKLKSVKSAPCSIGSPSPRKNMTDHAQNKRANLDKMSSSRGQQSELKSTQQLKRHDLAGTLELAIRSKSAVDFITYKDMFQQIQSGDEGPAIFEMFAGPIYENLRVSSSCEKVKDRQVQSAKVSNRPLKQPTSKLRRSPGERMVVSSRSKSKPVKSKPVTRKGPRKMSNVIKLDGHTESALSKDVDIFHNNAQDKAEDHKLSTIEEALSGYESETLKPEEKTAATSSHAEDYNHMHTNDQNGNSSIRNPNQPVPEPKLSRSLQQPKINTWTSSSSFSHTIMSPVYQKFLDEVGEGPLTDDLLQCLAEELISLDERDASIGTCPEKLGPSKEDSSREANLVNSVYIADLHGSGLVVDDSITWTKGEVLGRGAYGIVYCGLTSQGQLIAVKQVNLDASDPDAAKREYSRLQEEVELLKTLRHNNIVGFMGTSLHQHVVSIFMEYIPGGSIASILHRFGPLPERVLSLYTHQILKGVAYLHLNRVIHRDLKGNNVMLMPTGVIKLIDFGCARRLSCLNHTASNNADLLKSVHGTPYWMAPEVINETGYGRKSDIWSVGCTVFEMATGKPPLAHMNRVAAMFYIGAQRGLMPSLPDGFSDNAKDFVKICLTSDQSLRPSADQLLKHSFTSQTETAVNSRKTQKKNCCGQPEGLCS